MVEKTMKENPDIAVVYTTHNETGTGVGNPIREIGAIAHAHDAIFIVGYDFDICNGSNRY